MMAKNVQKEKKTARDSHIVRAKENLKFSYGWHSQRQALGASQR